MGMGTIAVDAAAHQSFLAKRAVPLLAVGSAGIAAAAVITSSSHISGKQLAIAGYSTAAASGTVAAGVMLLERKTHSAQTMQLLAHTAATSTGLMMGAVAATALTNGDAGRLAHNKVAEWMAPEAAVLGLSAGVWALGGKHHLERVGSTAKLLSKEQQLPKALRLGFAASVLPVPGPFDEILGGLCLLTTTAVPKYRTTVKGAWLTAGAEHAAKR